MIKLKYGNTNTFYVPGRNGGLLVDTDFAGTMPAFYKAINASGIEIMEIRYVLATHYHPDHTGLISGLMKQGVELLLVDVQKDNVHFSDCIFAKSGLKYEPIQEKKATVISCTASRSFLAGLGIFGEIIHTPSHSPDSVSMILDDGDAIVGDLEPLAYLEAYEENAPLKNDWDQVLGHHPKRVFYGHANEMVL